MKTFKSIYLLIAIVILLSGCAQPLLTNLQDGKYKFVNTAPGDILAVGVSELPLQKSDPVPEKTERILDQRDSLPHIFLRLFAAKTTRPEDLIDLMSRPINPPVKKAVAPKPVDYTEYKIRFLFSATKRYFNNEKFMHPNARLEFLNTSVMIKNDSSVYFYTMDKLQNDYETIDFGEIGRDQTVTFNTKLSAQGDLGTGAEHTNNSTNKSGKTSKSERSGSSYDDDGNPLETSGRSGEDNSSSENSSGNKLTAAAKLTASGEVGYLNNTTIREAVDAKQKRIKTGFSFSPKKLTLSQRGIPMGEISHDNYLTAILKVKNNQKRNLVNTRMVYSFDNLFNIDNEVCLPEKLSFSKRAVSYISCKDVDDIVLETSFEGAVRVVDDGNNVLEYDDKVTYYRIPEQKGGPLTINKNSFCKSAFKVTALVGEDKIPYTLYIAAPIDMQLNLFSEDSPQLFLQWLINSIADRSSSRLTTDKFQLYFENDRATDRIDIVNKGMKAADMSKIKRLHDIQLEEISMNNASVKL